MKKIKLTTFLNILLFILLICTICYCFFNYKNAELRYGIKGINENEGKVKTKVKYEEVPSIYSNEYGYYFRVLEDKGYGFVDEKGKQIIECKYNYISDFDEYGYARVKGYSGKCATVNSKGEQLVHYEYDTIYSFNKYGYATVSKDGKYGICNRAGQTVIACEYDYIENSEEEYVKIEKNEKFGLVDINEEKVILDCEYDSITQYFPGRFLLEKDNTYYYYRPKYNTIQKMTDEWKNDLENKFVVLNLNEEYVVLNLVKDEYFGDEIVCTEFDKNGGAWVEINGKYGYINTEGEFLIECKYTFIEQVDVLEENDKYGFINDEILEFIEEYTIVSDENGKSGIINNKNLELVVECKYKFINWKLMQSKYLIAFGEDENYIIDTEGNIIRKCEYGLILENPYNQNYYITINDDNKYGIIDKNFNEILECKYDMACVYGEYIYIENNGQKTIFDFKFNEILTLDEYDDFYFEGEYIIVKKDDKYGAIDFQGNKILECKYYKIDLENNLVAIGRKEINIAFIVSATLGSIFIIALVINNICAKRRKQF